MKKRIVIVICAAVLLAAFCINAVLISGAKSGEKDYEAAALSSTGDKLSVALSAIYKRAGDVVLSLPHAGMTLTQTAIMKHFAGDTDSLQYLNSKVEEALENAYAEMDDILVDFDNILTSYNVLSGSTYRTKRTELGNIFAGLKSSNTELIRRTRTFISYSGSGYDSYYTAYCEQLQIVSEKFEGAATAIGNEYDALISGLMGGDYHLVQ